MSHDSLRGTMRHLFTVSLLILSTPALGNPAEWCLKAYADGRIKSAERHAKSLLRTYTAVNKQDIKNGIQCLKKFDGKDYIYYADLSRFLTREEYANLKTTLDREKMESERKEADRKLREAEKAKEDAARARQIEEIQRMAAEQKAERAMSAYQALADACNQKYREDRFQAITTKLCFDHFTSQGLPE
ncbi:hypothetical protein [Paracoccus simplex]|uniref:Uncharacterized protein n=1 Tax=Paracoccus simplex TaxID=2086346 RepID=A0ABV7RWN7_9RHOB